MKGIKLRTPEPQEDSDAPKFNLKIKRSKDSQNVWGFEPVETDLPNTPQDKEESEESEHPEFRFKSSNFPEHEFTTPDGTLYVYFEGNYFLKLSTLSAGQSFGELALIEAGSKRNATVMCETDCVFITLSKYEYSKSLGKMETRKQNKRIDFLR